MLSTKTDIMGYHQSFLDVGGFGSFWPDVYIYRDPMKSCGRSGLKTNLVYPKCWSKSTELAIMQLPNILQPENPMQCMAKICGPLLSGYSLQADAAYHVEYV